MYLLELSILFFVLAAVFGLIMLQVRRRQMRIAPTLAFAHGVFAVAGLVALLAGVVSAAEVSLVLMASVMLFLGVAAGGLALLAGYYFRKIRVPVPLIVLHGAVAAAAFVLLVVDRVTAA